MVTSTACVESEGIIYSDTKWMATIFNEYFASIGTRLANRFRSLTTVTTIELLVLPEIGSIVI